jgi:hypothetical protein
MKRLVLLLILTGFTCQLRAQLFLVLRNGTKVEFRDFANSTAEFVRIKTKEGKKEFKVEEVDCYYDLSFVPTIPIKYSQFESIHYFGITEKGNIIVSPPRLMEGAISIFRYFSSDRYHTYVNYEIEKNGKVESLNIGHNLDVIRLGDVFSNKSKVIKQLQSYFEDAPELQQELISDDFLYSEESVIDIIRKYNVLKFQKTSYKNAKMSSVFLYSRMKNSVNETLQLILNDSLEVTIPPRKMIAIQIATDALSKICVRSLSSSTQENCLIVSGSPYFIKYYEVYYNLRKESLAIKPVHTVDAQNYIRSVINLGK